MPSRWLSIILVVMIGAQILVAGCALMLIGNELATAVLCQDHLREQIYAASRRKWDFRRKGGKKWQRRSRGKGRGRPREKPPKDGESAWWAEPVASVPKLNLAAQDVEQWAEELQDYHGLYRPQNKIVQH